MSYENTKKWVETHREKFNEGMRKLMAKRRLDPVKLVKIREYQRKWYQNHKAGRAGYQRKYRAKKKSLNK